MLKEYLIKKQINPVLEKKLIEFAELSLEWNTKINITAIRNIDDFISKNIIDSISVAGEPAFEASDYILDLGTGGGLPGVPLAIIYPEKKFVLADSIGKKLSVINDICTKLSIDNITTLHGRAEDLAHNTLYREKFDIVVSRAVSNMSVLSEYCIPFVKKGGFFIAYKTMESMEEITSSESAINKLGGSFNLIKKSDVEGSGHIFVIVEKVCNTHHQYPRKAGIPLKKPLC